MTEQRVSGAAGGTDSGEVDLSRFPENERAGGRQVVIPVCGASKTHQRLTRQHLVSVGGGLTRRTNARDGRGYDTRPGEPARRQKVSPPTRHSPVGRRTFSEAA